MVRIVTGVLLLITIGFIIFGIAHKTHPPAPVAIAHKIPDIPKIDSVRSTTMVTISRDTPVPSKTHAGLWTNVIKDTQVIRIAGMHHLPRKLGRNKTQVVGSGHILNGELEDDKGYPNPHSQSYPAQIDDSIGGDTAPLNRDTAEVTALIKGSQDGISNPGGLFVQGGTLTLYKIDSIASRADLQRLALKSLVNEMVAFDDSFKITELQDSIKELNSEIKVLKERHESDSVIIDVARHSIWGVDTAGHPIQLTAPDSVRPEIGIPDTIKIPKHEPDSIPSRSHTSVIRQDSKVLQDHTGLRDNTSLLGQTTRLSKSSGSACSCDGGSIQDHHDSSWSGSSCCVPISCS